MDVDGHPVAYEDEDDDAETDGDEEIDQLDSDTEEEAPAPASHRAQPAKARQRRPAQRVPGQAAIPLDRVETILDSEGACAVSAVELRTNVGTGMGSHMSKEALFMLAAATVSLQYLCGAQNSYKDRVGGILKATGGRWPTSCCR